MPATERRDQLLDAALRIIARDGYRAVSVEAIAREVDVTRPVVYNIFDGLEALLHALLDRQERRALEELLRTISAEPVPADPSNYLGRTIRDLVAMIAGDPLTWTPILLASRDTPDIVRARIDRDREVVRARIQALVEVALGARGIVAGGIDTWVVSHALIAMAEHFGRLILQDAAAVDADRLATTVTGLLFPARSTAS